MRVLKLSLCCPFSFGFATDTPQEYDSTLLFTGNRNGRSTPKCFEIILHQGVRSNRCVNASWNANGLWSLKWRIEK
ncbi:hypothetical protein BJV82DRAFT_585012 [Fennellomyces sp. T-0311]|nr:hypothetical protein BJV82DRAFT_584962 [Fennellomyces sp. T-0311]KAI8149869.1 hypothetical protein BJV82DRAFT_585012 [Fennellomyces sp. T-0311]